MTRLGSIQTRLNLLAIIGTSAVAAVAVAGFLSVDRVAERGVASTQAQGVLTVQQRSHGVMQELRADVLSAVSAVPGDRAVTLVTTTRSVQQLRTDLAQNGDHVAAYGDAGLTRRYTQTRDRLLQNAAGAEHLLALVSTDPAAARRALPAFLALHKTVDEQMADLTERLSVRADVAREASADAGRQGRVRSAEVAVVALLLPLGLCFAITLSVRVTLAAKAAAECAVHEANAHLTQDAARERFDATLKDAFDMAVTENEAQSVVRRAVVETVPGHRAELLLADNSRAHLTRAMTEPGDQAPGCGVLSPSDCIAVRRGRPAVFTDTEGVGACPKLIGRGADIGQAACSPVTFLGEGLGVLHVVSAPGQTLEPDALRSLAVTAEQAGNRIGTLRAFSRSQLQANTDGLTGLLNRRSAEERVGELQRGGRQLAVALCDLDHFKKINDTFGHEAGDRALRVFSATLRSVMRTEDLVARYGGEEFLLVMPDCGLRTAQDVLGRIRDELSLTLQAGGAPEFTASFGLALLNPTQPLDDVMRQADAALMKAKADGRNRVVIAEGSVPATP
jgi:diguanylate cyclase (GGDEF)-like protein